MKYMKFGKISAVTLMAFALTLIAPGIALGSGPIQSGDIRDNNTIVINLDEERADNVIVVHTGAGEDVAIILKFDDERDDLVIIVDVDDDDEFFRRRITGFTCPPTAGGTRSTDIPVSCESAVSISFPLRMVS